jgi:hypothetical protein
MQWYQHCCRPSAAEPNCWLPGMTVRTTVTTGNSELLQALNETGSYTSVVLSNIRLADE